MKKTVLHAALFALTLPVSAYSVGLGEMKIESALDQPFLAEIELLDIGSAPIVSIKVGVADPESFERIGLNRTAVLSLLNFKIEKNAKGKLVIKVRSTERMTEPYMELVVDLTWPKGQLYKAYTVLLDPPGYQLVSTTAQSSPTHYNYNKSSAYANEPGVINKKVITSVEHPSVGSIEGKKKTTYGPTITNENVWQIAQRYKTSDLILPQVVLAIVGANPDAFKDGNLNGLKVGVRLSIPATQEMALVPAELATAEVMAHDKAWNDKASINHVLSPPYTNPQPISTSPPVKYSEIPAAPKFNIGSQPTQGTLPHLLSINTSTGHTSQQQTANSNNDTQQDLHDSKMRAEISITTAAVESVRESNSLLTEQLHLLQNQNKKLQEQLDKRDKDMEAMRAQLQVIMKQRQAIASQATASTSSEHSPSLWPWLLLLLAAVGGAGGAYWYFKVRKKADGEPSHTSLESEPLMPAVEQTPATIDTKSELSTTELSVAEPALSVDETPQDVEQSHDLRASSQLSNDSVVASEDKAEEPQDTPEDNNDTVVEEHSKSKKTKANKLVVDLNYLSEDNQKTSQDESSEEPKEENKNDAPIEFEPSLHELTQQKPKKEVKSKKESDNEPEDKGLDFVSALLVDQVIQRGEKEKQPVEPNHEEHKPIEEEPKHQFLDNDSKPENTSPTTKEDEELDPSITEFFADSHLDETDDEGDDTDDGHDVDQDDSTANPLKSKKALNTLLALAKTYIGMDDLESAKHSLEEVMAYGSDNQKAQAQALLDEIKDK